MSHLIINTLITLTILFFTLPVAYPAQTPHPMVSAVEAGRALFQKSCAGCHGENAKGGRGPDLTTGKWRWGGSDSEILRNILQGIAGTQMPAFPMPEDEARSILVFLRSFQGLTPDEPLTGDPQAGRQLFFGTARCSRCHMFGGQGGRLGPDLSRIKDEKGAVDLRQAITRPKESLRENFQTAKVEFHSGKVLSGVAKNNDTFSIQILDNQEAWSEADFPTL